MTEVTSQDAGINADTVDTETPVTDNQMGDDGATKKKSGVPKLLADKNAALQEVEALRQQLDELKSNSISKDNLEAEIELRAEEKNVLVNLDEEGLEKYNAMKEDARYASLRPSEIAKLMDVQMETSNTTNTNRLSISGTTPASIKKQKTLQEKSMEELRVGAEQELRELLGH